MISPDNIPTKAVIWPDDSEWPKLVERAICDLVPQEAVWAPYTVEAILTSAQTGEADVLRSRNFMDQVMLAPTLGTIIAAALVTALLELLPRAPRRMSPDHVSPSELAARIHLAMARAGIPTQAARDLTARVMASLNQQPVDPLYVARGSDHRLIWPPPSVEPSSEELTHALLVSAFTQDELRQFIFEMPEGERVLAQVPERPTMAEMASVTLQAMRRHGLLDATFFARLYRERPRRTEEIVRAYLLWQVQEERR